MASATPPSCILLNVDMISEACDFEMIVNKKHEDEDKHSKNSGAERSKDRRTERVWDTDGITMHLNYIQQLPASGFICEKNNLLFG